MELKTTLVNCPHCGIVDVISIDEDYHTCTECGDRFLTAKFGMPVTVENLLSATGDVAKTATKHDSGKPDLALLPKVFLDETAKALMLGERKYSRYNYTAGFEYSRLISAAMRHLTQFNDGEETDIESGLSHLGHASACIAMLLHTIELGTAKDNRLKAKK
jgi:DNA-directed RNA polymerase subunit RPC12/RpoP